MPLVTDIIFTSCHYSLRFDLWTKQNESAKILESAGTQKKGSLPIIHNQKGSPSDASFLTTSWTSETFIDFDMFREIGRPIRHPHLLAVRTTHITSRDHTHEAARARGVHQGLTDLQVITSSLELFSDQVTHSM